MPALVTTAMRARTTAIGARIKAGRHMRGWSQERLAEALRLTFQQVQKYENGKNRVAACTLIEIADALDLDISFFLPPSAGAPVSRAELDQARRDLAAALASFDRIAAEIERQRAAFEAMLDRARAAEPMREAA